MDALLTLIVVLGVVAIVIVAAWYIVGQVAMPEPVRQIITIAFVVLAAVVCIVILLRLTGGVRLLTEVMV